MITYLKVKVKIVKRETVMFCQMVYLNLYSL